MRALGTALLLVAGLTLSPPAGAVEGGAPDRATTHAVAIATGGPLNPVFLCSGTLIAPSVVLTARHCIARFPSDRASCSETFGEPTGSAKDLWVTAAPWTLPSRDWKHVARWVVPEPSQICGNDVALLVLGDIFTAKQATPARPVLDEAELRDFLRPRTVGIAGFGATSASGTGGGTRNSRFDIPVVCVPGDLAFPCAGLLDSLAFGELTSGAGPCVGDSGAGAMATADHGVILGVLARGDTAVASCAAGVFERTDVWGWLIAKTVLESSFVDPPPPWASAAFPERPAVGQRCRGDECGADASCVSLDARRSFVCARRCSAGCAESFHCESSVCVAGAAPDLGGGCAVRGRGAPSSVAGALIVVLAAAVAAARALRHRGRPPMPPESSRPLAGSGSLSDRGRPPMPPESSRPLAGSGSLSDRGRPPMPPESSRPLAGSGSLRDRRGRARDAGARQRWSSRTTPR